MLANGDEYMELLASIKREIAESRHRAILGVNAELICMYWRIGQSINDRAEWGSKFIDTLSRDIKLSFPDAKGFSSRNLRYMAKFARETDREIVQTLSAQLSWSHNVALMDKVKSAEERAWYARGAIENGWSLDWLVHQIGSDLYRRQMAAPKTTNFEKILPSPDSELAESVLKDPYVFDFIAARDGVRERELEDEMVRNVTDLLLELGTGFAFVGKQYHLVVSDTDFYIDLLFYNIKLKCYVVVELKTGAFKPEYAGKLNFYLSAIDDLLRDDIDKPTIGLLLCKTKDNAIAEYSLRDMDKPIGVSEYRLTGTLPENVANVLPSPEDLMKRIGSV